MEQCTVVASARSCLLGEPDIADLAAETVRRCLVAPCLEVSASVKSVASPALLAEAVPRIYPESSPAGNALGQIEVFTEVAVLVLALCNHVDVVLDRIDC